MRWGRGEWRKVARDRRAAHLAMMLSARARERKKAEKSCLRRRLRHRLRRRLRLARGCRGFRIRRLQRTTGMRRIVKGRNRWRKEVTCCALQRAEALGWNTAAAAAARDESS